MKNKLLLMSLVTLLTFCNCLLVKANIEKKLNNIINEQNIDVKNNTSKNIDSLEKLIMKTRSDSVSIDDLTHMQQGEDWFKNNWNWLLSTIIFLLEIFLRIAPTNKDWSIVNKILSILIWIWRFIPNNAKVNNNVINRGYDIRLKKAIDEYKKKKNL